MWSYRGLLWILVDLDFPIQINFSLHLYCLGKDGRAPPDFTVRSDITLQHGAFVNVTFT